MSRPWTATAPASSSAGTPSTAAASPRRRRPLQANGPSTSTAERAERHLGQHHGREVPPASTVPGSAQQPGGPGLAGQLEVAEPGAPLDRRGDREHHPGQARGGRGVVDDGVEALGGRTGGRGPVEPAVAGPQQQVGDHQHRGGAADHLAEGEAGPTGRPRHHPHPGSGQHQAGVPARAGRRPRSRPPWPPAPPSDGPGTAGARAPPAGSPARRSCRATARGRGRAQPAW